MKTLVQIVLYTLLFLLVKEHPMAAPMLPSDLTGNWTAVGRGDVRTGTDSVIISGGYLVESNTWTDGEISFDARAPETASEVQIWGGVRFRDRDSRYVFALRGGHDNDVYLARYAPDGKARFLGFAPLDFKPVPGTWYHLRVVTIGGRFQIYLGDEKLPRLNVEDTNALWTAGSPILGGGWLPAEFAHFTSTSITDKVRAESSAVGNQQWSPPGIDREALRVQQRASYAPAKVAKLNPLRTEISLDGNWLLLPDYENITRKLPVDVDVDDSRWHVMPVPAFWTPGLSWLHGENGFPELTGVSQTKGVAESLYVQEYRRCDGYTFDWRKTSGAWYRHYVDLPADLQGRRFDLNFGAIAKVSEIWVNGVKVGAHTGMFGQVNCDITSAVRPGSNVIVAHVVSKSAVNDQAQNKVEGVAVTVEVTSEMLKSLPHGMLQPDVGGIWQPVTLTITAPVLIRDVYVQPGLHGADISLEVLNTLSNSVMLSLDYTITSITDGTVLYSTPKSTAIQIASEATTKVKLSTPQLKPKLWSPQDPNLYELEVRLSDQDKVVDNSKVRFGFRTFTCEGSRFLLNGRPFWLRGANPFPNALRPNDRGLARRFMEFAKSGNVTVTRSHIVPFTPAWLDAADQMGIAVSFEGTWPWLMLRGQPPSADLIQDWRDEFLSLIHEYRNHPSIILWTVNNEMKFEQADQDDPALLSAKWKILDDTVRAMHRVDPTRPVVADSSYVRSEALRGYRSLVQPRGLDDGDVDDVHRYLGWYNDSFFHFYNGEFNRLGSTNRPLISQEMATGYPNNDDGHPTRFYLFKHYTPQALVGDDAYENADPAIFLSRQAFMTKELAEALRRTSHHDSAGILYFAYSTWFQTPWSEADMKPWPAYYAIKAALQPVLVSAELYGRHYYAGSVIHRRVCVVNDAADGNNLPAGKVVWEFQANGRMLSGGSTPIAPVKYYDNQWTDVDFQVPSDLPQPRLNGRLVLHYEIPGKVISENAYDVTLASADWANAGKVALKGISWWDPGHNREKSALDLPVSVVDSPAHANPSNILVVGSLTGVELTPPQIASLRDFVSEGGRVLMLHPGTGLQQLFPDQIKSFKAKAGEIVTLHMPESPVFSEIQPLDLAWFNRSTRDLPVACTGVYQTAANHPEVTALAWQCDIHGYLNNKLDIVQISGAPLLEIRQGKGRLLASEMSLETGADDPIARRLLMNALHFLQEGE